MSKVQAGAGVKSVVYERVIHRADGRIETLPTVRWHRNPIIRAWWRLRYR